MDAWEEALIKRTDLKGYGNNHVLLFALELNQMIDDILLVANDALTDGPNDKKCDLVYVNPESGKVIIAQSHWKSNDPSSKFGDANKASDLNTAASWIFQPDISKVPALLQAAAKQVQISLIDSQITSIEFWFVHNCNESENVKTELNRVVGTADSLIRRYFNQADVDSITYSEVGRQTLDTWYRASQAPILVSDVFEFKTQGGFFSSGKNWEAYSTSIPISWLKQVYDNHGKNLFSANVRDYLGSRRSDKNINHNIKKTASERPDMFWVYNNGITALVNDFKSIHIDHSETLKISGIAIVNGAQTTGAIGGLVNTDLSNAYVPARFVKCSDQATIREIIRYNNSQNKIEAADFRSNDKVQTRLRTEFSEISNVEYTGGRRGGVEDIIRRSRNSVSSYTVGQALMAFHGDPAIAYNERSEIWRSDALYSRIFHDSLTAKHALCAYSLLKAVDQAKAELKAIPDDTRTTNQNRYLDILRQRGATFVLVAAIAASLEAIISRQIPNKYRISFKQNLKLKECIDIWRPIVDLVIPLVNQLSQAFTTGNISSGESYNQAVISFVDMFEAIKSSHEFKLNQFTHHIES